MGLLIIICCSLILFFLISNNDDSSKNGNLIEVKYNDIIKKVNDKDSFILVISQSTCSHCATYRPKLMKIVQDYDINIYYIDYDKESETNQNKFLDEFNLSGATPTTIFIKDGEEVSLLSRLEGDLSVDKVVKQFKKMGFIKE